MQCFLLRSTCSLDSPLPLAGLSSLAYLSHDNTGGHGSSVICLTSLPRLVGSLERSKYLPGFLREVKRYLLITDLDNSCWGIVAAHSFGSAAVDVWELELDEPAREGRFDCCDLRQV